MIKQERYAQKMIREGFVTVRSWVPVEKEEELKRITQAWREEKKARDKETDIQPPLEIGTPIKEGVITGIYEHWPACYLVKAHDCDNRYMLIKFEDAQEVAE